MNITKIKQHLRAALIAYAIVIGTVAIGYLLGSNNGQNQYVIDHYPVLSQRESVALAREVRSGLEAKPETAAEYFRLREILTKIEMAETRAHYLGQRYSDPRLPSTRGTDTRELSQRLTGISGAIEDRDYGAWSKARRQYDSSEIVRIQAGCAKVDLSGFFRWLLLFHFGGALLAFGLRLAKAKENGASAVLELANIYAWRDGLLWEYYAWRNPDITLQQQLTMLWRVLTSAFVSSLSLAGGVKAFGQDKPKQESEGENHSLVADPHGKRFIFTLEMGDSSRYDGYLVGRRFHDGHILTTALTVDDNRTGLFGSVWTSKSLTKRTPANFGDEWDFIAGIKRRWHSLNLKADLTAINSRPLSRWPAGDVIIPSLRVGKDFSKGRYGAEPFGQVHYSFPAGKRGPRKGWIFHFGANHSFKVSERLSLSGTTSGVKHTGPFGFQAGAHANLDFGVNWKVSDHLSITAPSGKVLVPLTRSGDGQHPLANVSMGLRYAW